MSTKHPSSSPSPSLSSYSSSSSSSAASFFLTRYPLRYLLFPSSPLTLTLFLSLVACSFILIFVDQTVVWNRIVMKEEWLRNISTPDSFTFRSIIFTIWLFICALYFYASHIQIEKRRIKKQQQRRGSNNNNNNASSIDSSSSPFPTPTSSSSPTPNLLPFPDPLPPSTRQGTRKRFTLVISAGLLSCITAVVFELYVVLNETGSSNSANGSSNSAERVVEDWAFLHTISSIFVYIFSFFYRFILLFILMIFCCYTAYHLWYRKAIGVRKTSRKKQQRLSEARRIKGGGVAAGGESIEFSQDIEDGEDGGYEDSSDEEDVIEEGDENASDETDAATATSASSSTSAPSPPIQRKYSDEYDEDEEEKELKSFPIPSHSQLLMIEKLDAALFQHPEQVNQSNTENVDGDLIVKLDLRGQPINQIIKMKPVTGGDEEEEKERDSANAASTSTSTVPVSPLPFTLPLSSSSPLLHSTLYHLASTKFLSGLSETDFQAVLPELSQCFFSTNEIICRRGEHSSAEEFNNTSGVTSSDLFIIVSGCVAAIDPVSNQILNHFYSGDAIGELEFLYCCPRPLTMIAINPVQLLRIPYRLSKLWKIEKEEFGNDASPSSLSAPLHPPPAPPRSDILLSFIRTTLARQFRSANFVLNEFLKIPLDEKYKCGGGGGGENTNNNNGGILSRYYHPSISSFLSTSSPLFHQLVSRTSQHLELSNNSILFEEGTFRSDQLFFVLEGRVILQSSRDAATSKGVELGPGSVLNLLSYMTDSCRFCTVKAINTSGTNEVTRIGWLNRSDLLTPSRDIQRLCMLAIDILCPTLSQFQMIGFERKWIRSGTLIFAQGQKCSDLFVVGSGRIRIVTGKLKRARRRNNHTSTSSVSSAPGSSTASPTKPSSSPASTSSTTISSDDFIHCHPSGYDLSPFLPSAAHLPWHVTSSLGVAQRTKPVLSRRVRFELSKGEMLGEVSFLDGINDATGSSSAAPVYNFSALASKDSEIIQISRPCFDNLIKSYPMVLLTISKILANKFKQMAEISSSSITGAGNLNSHLKRAGGGGAGGASGGIPRISFLNRNPIMYGSSSGSRTSTNCVSICILTPSPLVDLNDVGMRLKTSLSAHGKTLLLTSQYVDRILGAGLCASLNSSYSSRSLFSYWLGQMESLHSYCLFVCDAAVSPWSLTCTRQADLTLTFVLSDDNIEDDCPDEEDENLLQERRRARGKQVTQFEKLLVWNENYTAMMLAQQELNWKKKIEEQKLQHLQHPHHHHQENEKLGTTNSHTLDSKQFFSPTLHPIPPPLTKQQQNSPSNDSSGVTSSSSSFSSAPSVSSSSSSPHTYHPYPRINFSLRDLVILHSPTSSQPRGTRYWCNARPKLHRFHHAAIGCREHFDRLARYLSGRSVGLVLSGGGARGLSHLGILCNFAEQLIPVDYVGGTSQGSFMSSVYAQLPQHHIGAMEEMKKKCHLLAEKMGSLSNLLSDATFPILSYFSGERFGQNISQILGELTRIEDTWLPLFVVTTNLSQADMCVHDRGVLWKAVRASMTVLEYLPPMQISRKWPDLLIDGGSGKDKLKTSAMVYTNNLPVDVMHHLYSPCYVIAADVENKSAEEKIARTSFMGSAGGGKKGSDRSGGISGVWLLRMRLQEWIRVGSLGKLYRQIMKIYRNKFRNSQNNNEVEEDDPPPLNFPKFSELVGSLIYINHNRAVRSSFDSALIDLYLRPDLKDVAMLDYGREKEIVEIGAKFARRKLTEWRIKNWQKLPLATPMNENSTAGPSGSMEDNNINIGSSNNTNSSHDGLSFPTLQRGVSSTQTSSSVGGSVSNHADDSATATSSNGNSILSHLTRRHHSQYNGSINMSLNNNNSNKPPQTIADTSTLQGSPLSKAASSTHLAKQLDDFKLSEYGSRDA